MGQGSQDDRAERSHHIVWTADDLVLAGPREGDPSRQAGGDAARRVHPTEMPLSNSEILVEKDLLIDRALGSFLGLAVGDALGTTLEFSARDSTPHHTEMLGGGPFKLKPGEWTDDTAMALALADSLLACGRLNARDLMKRFVRWWDHGDYSCTGRCFDIGLTTSEALETFLMTGNPYAGSTEEDTAGNGSLMRVAPLALFTMRDPAKAVALAREQSRTTHGAELAVEACAFFTDLLLRAFNAGDKTSLGPCDWPGPPIIQAVARGSWKGKDRRSIVSSGYVVATLEAALWCIDQTNSFEEALVLAVNLADDADTVGAVTGQLAGAIYGASSIPERWLRPLAWRDRLEATGLRLTEASGASVCSR